MKIHTKEKYTPVDKLESMKLALVYDSESKEKVLMFRALDEKHYVFSNYDNGEGVCTLWTSDLKNYTLIGYISDMNVDDIKLS